MVHSQSQCRLRATTRERLVPPQVVTEHASRNEAELDLARSFNNRELTGVSVELFDRVIFHITRGTEQLHGEP